MRSSLNARKAHTFRSGPYLNELFAAATMMDQAKQQEICGRIKQARTEAGFTLQDAADALDVTLRAYQNYEKSRVPFRRLAEIGILFNVEQDWILRGTQPAAKSELGTSRGEVRSLRKQGEQMIERLDQILQGQAQGQRGTR